MKINAKLNEKQNKSLESGLKKLCELHKEYHNANACDDLVSLAFKIGMNYQLYTFGILKIIDLKTASRISRLYSHLAEMCERKAFKIYNQ